MAYDILQLAACSRAFIKCEKKEREGPNSGYKCESGEPAYVGKPARGVLMRGLFFADAVWPLIGHLSWFCDFSRELLLEEKQRSISEGAFSVLLPLLTLAEQKNHSPTTANSSSRLFLLLHPLPRSLLLKTVEAILGLQAFLGTFPSNSNITVDLSRTVLDDTIEFNGLVAVEWRNFLQGIDALEGIATMPADGESSLLIEQDK